MITSAPRVSVVVPCYNSAWSVERTLRSILAQRMTEFELIVVNDGSTDDLHRRIEGFLSDRRVRVIDQDNRGLAGARNRGIAETRASLVAPLDADDLWHPDFLMETLDALDKFPSAPFAYAYSFRIDEQDHLLPIIPVKQPPRHDFLGLLSLNSVANGSAAVFRRALIEKFGGYDERLRAAEDWKLILQLASLGTPALVERHLVGYRYVATGMSQGNPRRQCDAVLAVIADLQKEFPKVSKHWFADARTMMTTCLLPAFLRHGLFGDVMRETFHAYIRNPLWFRNATLRQAHLLRLRIIVRYLLGAMAGRATSYPSLCCAEMEGTRPFAFMKRRWESI